MCLPPRDSARRPGPNGRSSCRGPATRADRVAARGGASKAIARRRAIAGDRTVATVSATWGITLCGRERAWGDEPGAITCGAERTQFDPPAVRSEATADVGVAATTYESTAWRSKRALGARRHA